MKSRAIPRTEKLSEVEIAELAKNARVSYVYLGNLPPPPSLPSGAITVRDIDPNGDRELTADFVARNYFEKFPALYDAASIREFRDTLGGYLQITSAAKLFYKDGQVVGCFLANHFDPYPLLGRPTLHIGYWGYDRDSVTKNEARFIKSEWVKIAKTLEKPGVPVDVSVATDNVTGQKWLESLGFKICAYRLDVET